MVHYMQYRRGGAESLKPARPRAPDGESLYMKVGTVRLPVDTYRTILAEGVVEGKSPHQVIRDICDQWAEKQRSTYPADIPAFTKKSRKRA